MLQTHSYLPAKYKQPYINIVIHISLTLNFSKFQLLILFYSAKFNTILLKFITLSLQKPSQYFSSCLPNLLNQYDSFIRYVFCLLCYHEDAFYQLTSHCTKQKYISHLLHYSPFSYNLQHFPCCLLLCSEAIATSSRLCYSDSQCQPLSQGTT